MPRRQPRCPSMGLNSCSSSTRFSRSGMTVLRFFTSAPNLTYLAASSRFFLISAYGRTATSTIRSSRFGRNSHAELALSRPAAATYDLFRQRPPGRIRRRDYSSTTERLDVYGITVHTGNLQGRHATCPLSPQRAKAAPRRRERQRSAPGDGRKAAQAPVRPRNRRDAGATRPVSRLEAASAERRPQRIVEPDCHRKLAIDFPLRRTDEHRQRY